MDLFTWFNKTRAELGLRDFLCVLDRPSLSQLKNNKELDAAYYSDTSANEDNSFRNHIL